MLITICLNTEVYRQTIGELPETYIKCCTVNKKTNSTTITNEDKQYAITQYWIRNKGTGGYKINEKLSTNLFTFVLI